MGLDMYAYVAANQGQMNEHYENYDYDKDTSTVTKPREIAYWRKHPNLHGWMEHLWHKKRNAEGKPVVEDNDDISGIFNGVELELTHEDLDELERAVTHKQLPSTSGFFFGNDADDVYYESDLSFIKNARAELFFGLKVFYNSSW
jgi:hypothetical protein